MRIKCADLQSAILLSWARLFRGAASCCFAGSLSAWDAGLGGASLTASRWGSLVVVLGDGEHHNDNATDAIGDFLVDRGRIHSLRLHSHAETNEEAPKRNFAGSSAGS